MKKILKLTLVLALSATASYAQRNCGTMDHLHQQLTDDPTMQQRMDEIETHTQNYILNESDRNTASVTIPVVFHVLYNTSAQNISDARILAQLDVLNKDFRKLNSDIVNVPAAFSSLAADASVAFCLATVDPNGNPTSGIIRKSTTVTSFSSNNAMKYSAQGGNDAWNSSKYLNIWICNLGSGLLGYAQFPGGAAATDGVVVLFGTVGSASVPGTSTPYHLGRTLTHEVGHWLNLRHIWGDANCGSDLVSDTPTQQTSNYGCPTFPKVTCSNGPNGDMFMNYMDYVDDACMYMFTNGQKARLQALFATGGSRASLLSSNGCGAPAPSCGIPASLATSNITNTSATLSWAAVTGATSYNVRYKLTSSTAWTNTTSTTTSINVTGLTLGSTYEFQVQAVCSVTGAFSSSVNFTTTGGTPITTNTLTIGTGTSTTSNMPYGTYFSDHRSQIIITRAELIAAGYNAANNRIKSLAFFTGTASSQVMNNFTIKISHTTATQFSSTSFLSGSNTVTVFSGNVTATSNQWNTHNFATPFAYNGVNNILIDICFDNSNFTNDTPVRFTTTSSNMALYRRQDVASGNICATTTGTRTKSRPNVQFTFSNTARLAEDFTPAPLMSIFEIYPNPATSFLNVKYTVDNDNTPVTITVLNMTGQIVANISKGAMEQGEYLETIELNSDAAIQLPAGIYICTIQQGDNRSYKKFILNK
ncbi:MAG: M43 family zinc metalloprotease [Bacteroidota bacterium]